MNKVFVYGTLKKGNRLHHLLEDPTVAYLGSGWTQRSDFVLRRTQHKPHGFPIILQHSPGLPIIGELYDVPDRILQRLDFAESNGIMYAREILQLRTESGERLGEGWTYIGVPNFWVGSHDRQLPMCDIIETPFKHFSFLTKAL